MHPPAPLALDRPRPAGTWLRRLARRFQRVRDPQAGQNDCCFGHEAALPYLVAGHASQGSGAEPASHGR